MFELPPELPDTNTIETYAEISWDVFSNVSGGLSRDTTNIYLVNAGLSYQLSNAVQLRGGFWLTNDQSVSEFVGDDQVIDNNESGVDRPRFSELVIEWSSKNLSLLGGIYDLNSEFDVLDSAGLFINSAHGIGTDIGQTGMNGPSIYPTPGLALRASYSNSGHTIRTAILDGNPGDPDSANSQSLSLNSDEGALIISEYEFQSETYKVLAGAWEYTEEQALYENEEVKSKGNSGFYLRGEWLAFTTQSGRDVTLFSRLGVADGQFNKYNQFLSIGVQVPGNVFSNEDQWGVAVAQARIDNDNKLSISSSAETNIELTYSALISDSVSIQPNIQYVISPSASKNIDDALVIGVRFNLSFL